MIASVCIILKRETGMRNKRVGYKVSVVACGSQEKTCVDAAHVCVSECKEVDLRMTVWIRAPWWPLCSVTGHRGPVFLPPRPPLTPLDTCGRWLLFLLTSALHTHANIHTHTQTQRHTYVSLNSLMLSTRRKRPIDRETWSKNKKKVQAKKKSKKRKIGEESV